MRDESKTKRQLIEELADLRRRIAQLESSEAEVKRMAEAFRELEERYRLVVESASGAMILVGVRGTIQEVNAKALELSGFEREEVWGKNFAELLPTLGMEASSVLRTFKDIILGRHRDPQEWTLINRNGERITFIAHYALLRKEGKVTGLSVILEDITAQKRAAEAMLESQERFQARYKAIPVPTYTWQKVGKEFELVDYNDAALEITQGNVAGFVGRTASDVYGEDRPDIVRDLHRCFAERSVVKREMDYRFLTTGESKHLETTYAFVPPDLVMVHTQDITERKRAEEGLRESEKRYRTLFHDTRDAINITTREGQVLDANQSFLDLFGYTREEIAGLNAKELYVDPVDRRRFQEEIERKGSVRDYDVKLRKKDGSEMDCLVTSTVRRAEDGRVVGYQGFIHDVTERKQVEETIRRLAYYDALTGLPNRTLFRDRLSVAVARARRNRQRLAVMLLDLDHFKNVNDSLGHPVGDQLLQAVGERLTGLLRESDTVCRMGGDEFLVLLEGISGMEDVGEVADAILQQLRKPIVLKRHELHVTTSVGIAIYPEEGEDGDTLIRNADIAMYRAKDRGRDNYQRYIASENRKSTPS